MTNKMTYDLSVIQGTPHHPAMAELVDSLCHKTRNINRSFFQAEVAFFLAAMPSAMRATIYSEERGIIPINVYSIALATSGFGKGYSVNIMEEVIGGFRQEFMESTFGAIALASLYAMAQDIAIAKGTEEKTEYELLEKEFERLGKLTFNFDSGTGPAVKQLRYKLLLARNGAINLQIDEIGSNLLGNAEILNMFLELYDLGKVKTKLVKSTAENERGTDIIGSTPTNALLFGTTTKLFDGAKTEDEFFSLLETGYARRCFFGVGLAETIQSKETPEQIYDKLVAKSKTKVLVDWRVKFQMLADINRYDEKIDVPKNVGVELVKYRLACEQLAADMPEHEVVRKAEMAHRYFKSLKMAGVYAFIDGSSSITMENLHQGMKLAEEAGDSFSSLLKRDRTFVRLAKYIADSEGELTHADLMADLPFYKSNTTARKEIMDLAMAWGFTNAVSIKKTVISGVEFFSGAALKETNLDKLQFSHSDNFAYEYHREVRSFAKLPMLLKADGRHWANHYFKDDHRAENNVLEGFNLAVVDVDGTAQLDTVHELLKDYTFITATTKRHTEEANRFRLVMPINYFLHLNQEDYREFMSSLSLWFPFESDTAANQRSRKWMTNPKSTVFVNEGTKLLNCLPFIPKTNKNKEYRNMITNLGNLDNLERWFLTNLEVGNRNNNLLKYAMMLVDGGLDYTSIEEKVFLLNGKMPSPLKKDELRSTVLKTVASKV